jgi:hypothetical protein
MTVTIPTWLLYVLATIPVARLLYVLGAIPVAIVLAFAVLGAVVLFVFSRNRR